jgi:hypothetical protein
MAEKKTKTTYDEHYVRALSKIVYMKHLSAYDRDFMRSECDRQGKNFDTVLDSRAQAYDGMTRRYLDAIHEYGVKK